MDEKLWSRLRFPVAVVAILWLIHAVQWATGVSLGRWGIYSREISGIVGIVTAPLIHGSWGHLASNSAPYLFGLSMIWVFYPRVRWTSFILIYLLTGVGVWIFGRHVFHIGASGVVYGIISFLFFNGIFRGNVKSFAIALIMVLLYSGMVYGVLPREAGVSWESHLIGGIVGAIVSYAMKRQIEEDEKRQLPSWETTPEESRSFFSEDTFLLTRRERAERDREF